MWSFVIYVLSKLTQFSIFTFLFYADDAKKKKTGNMWTRSKNFKKLTDWAFKTIDADGSGEVDKKELYTGLLMIHLKLATYAGPAACRPATREYCEKIFDQMDVDKSGELDREEFTEVMQIVCAQVFTRVAIQWTMTLMIVPMSKFISRCLFLFCFHFTSGAYYVLPVLCMSHRKCRISKLPYPFLLQSLREFGRL